MQLFFKSNLCNSSVKNSAEFKLCEPINIGCSNAIGANGQLNRKIKVVREPKSSIGYGNTVFGNENIFNLKGGENMNNPDKVIVNGEVAYRYVKNPYYYITKSGVLYSTYVKGAHGKYGIERLRKVAYGQDKDGYYRVVLSLNKKRTYIKIHQIMANQFFGGCPDDMVINHKDGDKHNNEIENLEIITNLNNIQHAWETGLNNKELNPNRIAVDIYDNNLKTIHKFGSLEDASKFSEDISITYIRHIKNNEIDFNLCLFKKVKTGSGITDYFVECYYNGMLYKTFKNNAEAGAEFGRPKNSVSGAYKSKYPKKINRYTITFPNVSTTESIAV